MNVFIISLKRNFFTILFSLFVICLICFSGTCFSSATMGIKLWATALLPSLFPFLVGTELLCKTNFINILGRKFGKYTKKYFNVPGESVSAIILGILSGYPIGAKVVCNLRRKKLISKVEAERLIAFTSNSNPVFIISSVGLALFKNKKIGIILLLSHILSCIIVGIIFSRWKKENLEIDYNLFHTEKTSLVKLSNLGEILGEAIKNATATVFTIGGFVVIFSIIISIFELFLGTLLKNNLTILNSIKPILFGIIELTNGLNVLSASTFSLNAIILSASFLLGFGGFSIMFQIYSIITKEGISIKPYVYGKFLQGILSTILTYIFLLI